MTESAHRSIGEVVGSLEAEFPDITISKVRFLESRGLVCPERAASGYRLYSDTDVAQLRWVLHQQRDQYLPLRVISERLRSGVDFADLDAAADPAPRLRVNAMDAPDPDVELTGAELTARTGLAVSELASMEQFGLVRPASRRGRPVYSADDLVAAQLVARFRDHGVEPRHLRPFIVAAEREASLIDQRLSAVGSQTGRTDALRDLLRLGEDLRSLLLRRLVHDADR